MRISIAVIGSDTQVSHDFIPLEVFPDMSLDDVKGFVESEISIPPSAQTFVLNDQIVTETSQSLTHLGIGEGDVIGLAIKTKQGGAATRPQGESSQQRPAQRQRTGPDPEMLRLQVLGDQSLLRELQASDPELANSLNNSQQFSQILDLRMRQRLEAQREKEQAYTKLMENEYDEESQAKIEEIIRQDRVLENMQKAYEETPESFARVEMLYIDVLVNNVPIKAFVDSGAQTTIMSPDAAERCGIMRLIDKRFAGIARGVGTAQILGRVHFAEMQIGQYNLASSFTVMEGKDVDLLLGLDMLKRHQMCIDLKENCLKVAEDKVPFLPDSQIPRMMEHINENEPKVDGPHGMKIGAETGTIKPATPTPSTSQGQSSASTINIHPVGSAGNINTNRTPAVVSAPAPAPVPAAASQPVTNTPFNAPAPITEQSIAQIVDLGFSRDEAVAALQQVGGNVELAIGLLL